MLLVNCEKETPFLQVSQELHNSEKSNFSIKYVSIENIPILNVLFNSGKKSLSKTTADIENFGTISIANVMEVIDSLENKNYSFTLIPKIPKPNSIFNLVVNISNENTNMAIMEYRMAPNFALEYYNGTKDFSKFTGSIFKFPFNTSTADFAKTNDTCIQNTDEIVNCDQIDIYGGNIIGIPGGGTPDTNLMDTNTYTGADGGSTNYNYGGGYGGSVDWVCGDDGTSQWSPVECNGAGHSGAWVVRLPYSHLNKSNNIKNKTNTDNCCDDTVIDGGVGVNLERTCLIEGYIKDGNGNCVPNSYIIKNQELSLKSPFDVDMRQVLDSITLPKNDSILIANEKFLCLYEKLATSNTYKNLFVNIFGGSQDVLNVSFKVTKNLKHNGERANGLRSVLPGSTRDTTTGKVSKLNILIEIDEELLTSNSSFNTTKTILHESIHAYLTLKKYECNDTVPFGEFDNEDLCQTINSYYNDFNCSGVQGQHEFMFDNMLPVFKSVFEEIGKLNLTSQGSIDFIESNPLPLDNNPSIDWNWQDFYFYFSMQGLHNTDSFKSEIENDSLRNDLFNAYREKSIGFSKSCN